MVDHHYVQEGVAEYIGVLEAHGPAGLDYLNGRVPQRFTGVYRLESGVLHNVYLHDKLGEVMPEFLKAVPLQDSFCQFVLRDGYFCTCNTGLDRRLDGHKYQGVLNTYYGVPLLNNAGELYGTLCHFDAQELVISDDEFAFLQRAASVLPKYLLRKSSSLPVPSLL